MKLRNWHCYIPLIGLVIYFIINDRDPNRATGLSDCGYVHGFAIATIIFQLFI